jgi:hypothetical protein
MATRGFPFKTVAVLLMLCVDRGAEHVMSLPTWRETHRAEKNLVLGISSLSPATL